MKNNVIQEFERKVMNIVKTSPLPSLDERGRIITEVNESFIQATGAALPSYILLMLTDWFLEETLRDKDVDKVTNNEFAILSNRQLRRRYIRECTVGDENIDYLDQRFTKNKTALSKKLKKSNE